MAWEREYHHVDISTSEHMIGLVNRSIETRDGQPVRHLIQIQLGGESFELEVGHHRVRIRLGGGFTPDENGQLVDEGGNVFDPMAIEEQIRKALDAQHEKHRRYAHFHRAKILGAAGGGKTA